MKIIPKASLLVSICLLSALRPQSARAADWTIIKGAASTAIDTSAATELKRYVEHMTGKTVPIITDKQSPAQVVQYMVPEWFRLKNSLIYRTNLTEALYCEASDFDKCALVFDKWIYSNQFTQDWANANIPNDTWVQAAKGTWLSVQSWPSDMTYENKAKSLGGIKPGTLTVRLVDKQGHPIAKSPVHVARGYPTKIKFQDSFDVAADAQGEARLSLDPDIYEISIPGTQTAVAALMLHGRNTSVTVSLESPSRVVRSFPAR